MRNDPAEWFYRWVPRLKERVREPYGGWPDAENEWWLGVLDWMKDHRVTMEQGERMLSLIQRKPPKGVDDTIEALGRCLAVIRKEGGEYSDRAEKASAECKRLGCECGGMGLVSRDHMNKDHGRYTVSYYCPGPMGQFVQDSHARKKIEGIRPIVGSQLERVEDEAEFCRSAPPEHRVLAKWFAQRAAAIRDRRPMPPDPPHVVEQDRKWQERFKGSKISGRVAPAFPTVEPGASIPPPPPRRKD